MNLHRARLQLSAFFALVTLIVVGAFALYASRSGVRSIYDSAEREAEQIVAQATIDLNNDREFNNTWIVNVTDQWSDPLGGFAVEPPLFRLAERALSRGSYFERFQQDGPWLAHSRRLTDDQALVTLMWMEEFDEDATGLRLRIYSGAAAAIVAVSLAGYALAGRALEPAATAMDQQRAFIADAAHEMRTPLSVIQASASQALSREREPEAYKASLAEVRAAAERATDGVSGLLDFARLQSGQDPPRRAPMRLDLLAEEVAATLQTESVEIVALDSEPVVIDGDYSLMRQALQNLVRNAASRASRVEIGVRRDGGEAVIEVVDDGPGFEVELLPHVFERFRRGDQQGTAGLGLSIVQTIVEAHGGTCTAENGPSAGAIVRAVIPA